MDAADLRAAIPPLSEVAYCNWGATGPSPEPVLDAFEDFVAYHEHETTLDGNPYPAAWDHYDETRATVASFLGVPAESVALTDSTADGINRFVGALDWSPGDVVVTTDVEHPAGVLPWQRLAREGGVEVRVLETDRGLIDPAAAAEAMDGADLFAFSAVDWLYGRRQPVSALVDAAHEAGALALVDAVQAVGQLPVDLQAWGADAVAAAGHKWLLGTWGSGFLYVEPSLADRLDPGQIGYRSVVDPTAEDYEWAAGAPRFEVGTVNGAPYAALQAAVETITDVGVATVEDRIEALTGRLKDRLDGDRLRSPDAFESGLVTVATPDPDATVAALADADVVARAVPLSESVRVSLHAVNTAEEVDRVADVLTD